MTRKQDGTYTHNGRTIFPCSHITPEGYKWYLRTTHTPTGMAMDEQPSARYRSLRQAREDIDWLCKA
jgi:hypothetical protein